MGTITRVRRADSHIPLSVCPINNLPNLHSLAPPNLGNTYLRMITRNTRDLTRPPDRLRRTGGCSNSTLDRLQLPR